MRSDNVTDLPGDLPVPLDDGAADHLVGEPAPDIALPSTDGSVVRLSDVDRGVIFCYPRTGQPDREPPGGTARWNAIPGARGCTPQVCAYRDLHAELGAAGYAVFGISTQSTDEQREAFERLDVPFPLLSDRQLRLASVLRLPTFEVGGLTMLRRLTWVQQSGRLVHVRYPVFPPDDDAAAVLAWLEDSDRIQ